MDNINSKIGERIKEIRQDNCLTQEAFGKRIGSARNTIANYEIGKREPSNAILTLICKEFTINEEWLRTGSGDKTKKLSREEELAALTADLFNDDKSLKSRLIFALAKLDEEDLVALLKIATAFVDAQKEND